MKFLVLIFLNVFFLLLLLKWKKVTYQGVIAGLLTGFLVTVVWSEITILDQWVCVRFVSFVISFIAVFVVSKMTIKKRALNEVAL